MLFWGVFLRVTFNFHTTWLVNSATHLWGTRRFETNDDSRNSWWVALLTWGEGWHNNHHAHPSAARHGLAWYEVDVNWWGIRPPIAVVRRNSSSSRHRWSQIRDSANPTRGGLTGCGIKARYTALPRQLKPFSASYFFSYFLLSRISGDAPRA